MVSYKVPVPAAAGSVPRKYGYLTSNDCRGGGLCRWVGAPATALLSNPPTKGFGHYGMWGRGTGISQTGLESVVSNGADFDKFD